MPRSSYGEDQPTPSARGRDLLQADIPPLIILPPEPEAEPVSGPQQPIPRRRADVLQPLPRRPRLGTDLDIREATRPYARPVEVQDVSTLSVALRATRWMMAMIALALRLALDVLLRRNTPQTRAVHVRRVFESIGGTAIKFGQQLSVRVDFLPFEICQELAALLDAVPPFEVAYARERLAVARGCSVDDIVLDTEPIGSASVACVFRGVLPNGDRVAVKVRRPGVERKFMADIRVVDWLTRFAEVTTLVRPDFFKFLRSEVRDMFFDELDFRKEATFQTLFGRWAKTDRLEWLAVPEVYSELSSADVLTTSLADGVPCATVLDALETKNEEVLGRLAEMEIDPATLARRVMVLACWSRYERPFFHADPHPGNILFGPKNRLILLDFGACGVQGRATVESTIEMHARLVRDDFTGAADVCMATLQPLPYIDVTDLQYRLERHLWDFYVGAWTRDAEWYERTTARLWLNMVEVGRDLNMPINIDVLRALRATLLYDTLACRLDPKFHPPVAFKEWQRGAAQRSRRRSRKEREKKSPQDVANAMFATAADTAAILPKAGYFLNTVSRNLPVDNLPLVGKGAFFAESILRFMLTAIWLSIVIIGAVAIYFWTSYGREDVSLRSIAIFTVTRPLYTATMLAFGVLLIRSLLFRLRDKDRR